MKSFFLGTCWNSEDFRDIMGQKKNNSPEESFKDKTEGLLNLYDSDSDVLSEEEEASLFPILHSLNQQLDRYKELELVATGGEKKITRVYDQRLDRLVAMAHAVKAVTQEDQERFLREGRLVANLAHPNIPPIHNMGFDSSGVAFFSMEMITGDSLGNIIRKLRADDPGYCEKYPLDALLNLYLKVCDAISYAHSRNVLHLDIKPDNIRIGSFGELFVCDWGLARVVFDESSDPSDTLGELDGDVLNDISLTGKIKGTPGFMAPEQTLADGEVTVQTDIYALGALLYVLLTLAPPVTGDSQNEIIQNTREGRIQPPRLRRKSSKIPAGLAAVAMKALALDPGERYRNVSELQREITRFLSGFPTTVEHANMITRLSLLVKRHNRIAFTAIIFLFILAVTISVNMTVIHNQKASEMEARQLAEENFRLYREEHSEVQKLSTDLSATSRLAMNTKDYSDAPRIIRTLNIALKENLSSRERSALLEQKGYAHFVFQEFNAAAACFSSMEYKRYESNVMKDVCERHAKLKEHDYELLSISELTRLVGESWIEDRYVYFLYIHHIWRKNDYTSREYLPLAITMLNRLNGLKVDFDPHVNLLKTEQGYHLDLTQSPYSTFKLTEVGYRTLNVLAMLNLHSLDISYLPLKSLDMIESLTLDELRMVGLDIREEPDVGMIEQWVQQIGIKKLIIDADAYPDDLIRKIRQVCEVVNTPARTVVSP